MRFYKEQSELFEGIQNGDADAFGYVFKTYYPRLRNYANRFVSDSDDLEDILQNCFIHLWERRDSITFISISSLLFTMTPIRDKIAISCMLREIHEFSSHAIRHGLYIKNRKRLFCP